MARSALLAFLGAVLSLVPVARAGAEHHVAFVLAGAQGSSHDASTLAAIGSRLLVGSASVDGSFVQLVDARTGAVLQTLDPPFEDEGFSSFGAGAGVARRGFLVGDTGNSVAYLIDRHDGAVLARYEPPAGAGPARFGAALAGAGRTVLVGDPRAGTTFVPFQEGTGEAYLFDVPSGALLRRITDPAPHPRGRFGQTVVFCRRGFAVGQPSAPNHPGAVYVYDRTGTLVQTLTAPAPADGDEFGAALAAAGRRLLVGAPAPLAAGAGAVYVFERRSGTWFRVRTIGPPDPARTGFGRSLALAGRRAVVGDGGVAHLFDVRTGQILDTLAPPADQAGLPALDGFGAGVAIAGRTIAVASTGREEDAASTIVGFVP